MVTKDLPALPASSDDSPLPHARPNERRSRPANPHTVETPRGSVAIARREGETTKLNVAATPASADKECLEAPVWEEIA